MGERKVLNFYISPDFDHSIIPKMSRDWSKPVEIRMMLPFSLRCNTCGEYMYAGKKFNSKKEMIKGEDYLGIRKFRFIIKCTCCSSQISFKTDPKNSDYECESGASRNFEVWRDTETVTEQAKKEREAEDKLDPMKSLENRTLDSKLEMDILDALDEMKAINQRHERLDTSKIIDSLTSSSSSNVKSEEILAAEDEKVIKSVQFKKRKVVSDINEALANKEDEKSQQPTSITEAILRTIQEQKSSNSVTNNPIVTVKKKMKEIQLKSEKSKESNSEPRIVKEATLTNDSIFGSLVGYRSNSDSD
jgi:hypothetical protein